MMLQVKVDFHKVHDHHDWVHQRLLNWSRWVIPRQSAKVSPMFRDYRSHAWQWHPKEYRVACDTLEAQEVERLIATLPVPNREALRWCYVHQRSPARAARTLRVSYESLARLVNEGRSMMDTALRGKQFWTEEAARDLVKRAGF